MNGVWSSSLTLHCTHGLMALTPQAQRESIRYLLHLRVNLTPYPRADGGIVLHGCRNLISPRVLTKVIIIRTIMILTTSGRSMTTAILKMMVGRILRQSEHQDP